jgi:hypothetical protein
MGNEIVCRATLDGGKSTHGKALLETTELLLRGDVRARVPLAAVKAVTVSGDTLSLTWPGGTLALELGAAAAAKWAQKIRSPPSRSHKLGIKPGARVALVGDFAFDATFERELAKGGATVIVSMSKSKKGPVDLLFYAPTKRAELERIPTLGKRLAPAGALWIVRPKGKDTAVTESDTRKAGLSAGLVDVKVAAFSATHTAEKFVIPVAKRKG